MQMTPVFEASFAKLARARKFIDELKVALDGFISKKPFKAFFIARPDGPSIRIEWDGIGLEPGAIVGDCVHNLRTALDLMASELARINGESDAGVYFPFADTEFGVMEMVGRKKFDRCGDDAVRLLVGFAPFKGGDEMLRGLHDLDIQDKHRALILTHRTWEWRATGEVVVPEAGEVEVAAEIDTFNHVFHFPPDGPLATRPLIETLEELVQLVHRIIEAFARLVEMRAAGGT